MTISEKQALNAKRFVGAKLRNAGITDPATFNPADLDWKALNKAQNTVTTVARSALEEIGDSTPEAEARDREAAHDAVMELYDSIQAEKDHRDELGDRSARPGGEDPREMATRSAPIIGNGRSVNGDGSSGQAGAIGETAIALRHDQRMADYFAKRDQGQRNDGVTLGRYLRSMVVGAKSEAEHRALTEGTDSAGGYTTPTRLSAQLLDLLRARTVASQAGARTVPLTSDVNDWAKVISDPVPGWRGENASVAESEPTFGRIRFEPKMLSVLVKVSRELLEDSLNIEQELPRIMAAAMAVEMDRAVLFGSGSGNEPQGLFNDSSIQEVAHNNTLSSYSPLVSARTKIKTANAMPGAYVMHPRDEGTLADLTDNDGQPLAMPPALRDLPMLTTTSVPTDLGSNSPADESVILHGDWQYCLIGMRSDVRIEVLRERYMDTHQFGFLAHMRMDTARVHSDAFCKITGIQP